MINFIFKFMALPFAGFTPADWMTLIVSICIFGTALVVVRWVKPGDFGTDEETIKPTDTTGI